MAIEYRFAALEVRAADGGVVEGAAMPYGIPRRVSLPECSGRVRGRRSLRDYL